MKPSGPIPLAALQVASAACDVVGRLALPFAVLGVARGAFEPAAAASVAATVASLLRSWLAARATHRAFVDAWVRVAAAARRRPAAELPRRREDEESVASLLQGVWDESAHRAVTVAQAIGIAVSLLALTVTAFVRLGAGPTLAGGALLVALGVLTLWLARGLQRSRARAWDSLGELSMNMRLLLEGALELRAAGREAHAERVVVAAARGVASHQAASTAASLRVGLLPASLALLAVAAPLGADVEWARSMLEGRLLEASVLGGATLATAVAAARVWEQWVTTAPVRQQFAAFASAFAGTTTAAHRLARPLAEATIAFRGFAHDWGTGVLTPLPLDLELEPCRGVALCGPNGSGKTTVILGLLGAIRPTRGACEIDGTPACQLHPEALIGAIGYVPQDGLIMPGETLAWHCRLHEDASDGIIDEALRASGLDAVLDVRARARGVPVRELPAGELSGGERRKLMLARALQRPRALYVLDEPEAGLDAAAREELRAKLEELASRARVVVVVHDPTAVPRSFRQVSFASTVAHRADVA